MRQGPSEFEASADFTSELAEANPDWKLDLNDEVIGTWRGELGNTAEMTLVWGVPLIPGGSLVTAELANLAVDQCELAEQRFTLIAPDNYRSDFLEIKLWGKNGNELARESLYVEDEEPERRGQRRLGGQATGSWAATSSRVSGKWHARERAGALVLEQRLIGPAQLLRPSGSGCGSGTPAAGWPGSERRR